MVPFIWVLLVSVSLHWTMSGVSSFEPQPLGLNPVGPRPTESVAEIGPSPTTSTPSPIIHNTGKVKGENVENVSSFPVEEEKQHQSSQTNVKPPESSDSDFGRLFKRLLGAKSEKRNDDESHSKKISYPKNSETTTRTETIFSANPKSLEPLKTSQHMPDKITEIGLNPVAVNQSAQKDGKDSVLNSDSVYTTHANLSASSRNEADSVYTTNANLSASSHNEAGNTNVVPSNNKDVALSRSSEVQITDVKSCEKHEQCDVVNNSDQCKYGSVCTGVMILASSLYYYHSIGAFC